MQDPTTCAPIDYDVAVVGGGLAGSAAAALIGRSRLRACLIDPHKEYRADFRCEALTQSQIALLAKTGLLKEVLPVMTVSHGMWTARHGKIVERRRDRRLYGFSYQRLVMRLRESIAARTPFIEGTVKSVQNGADRQTVILSDGRTISARLVILAMGTNARLRRDLRMTQTEFSPTHSISLGFDVKPLGTASLRFPALTYYSESPSKRAAFLSFFPIESQTRCNLFVYRTAHDPWLAQFRQHPKALLDDLMPNLKTLAGHFEIASPIQIRPVDLYEMTDVARDGVVLIGDAFSNSCPAAGTGCDKVFIDVERLCNHHLPHWFASEGMAAAKLQSFYRDPVKTASDAHSRAHAFYTRALAVDPHLKWEAMRLIIRTSQNFFGSPQPQEGWLSRLQHTVYRRATAA